MLVSICLGVTLSPLVWICSTARMPACKKTIIIVPVLVVFLFCVALASNPTQCKQCLELNAADCTQNQVNQACDAMAIGVTHCASVSGLFVDNTGTVQSGFGRGCVNCSDKETACQDFATFLKKERNFILKECEIECCTSNDCNSATTPSLPSGPEKCYSCLESTSGECQTQQVIQSCRSDPSSLGITHCASAAGKFTTSSGGTQEGFARGCINCADKEKACNDLGAFLKETLGYTLQQCEIECCNTNNCNTGTPTLPTGTTTTTAGQPTGTASSQAFVTEAFLLEAAIFGLFHIF